MVLAAAVLLAGCQDQKFNLEAKLDAGVQKLFAPRKTPQQYMLVAVSSDDPDARRDAVVQIARSKQLEREWALKGLVAIAMLESEPQTRCVAIRALARSGSPRATETLLNILNYRDLPPEEVWPPNALTRWDATLGLAVLSEAGQVPEERRADVLQTLLRQLKTEPERHARIAAARGLGYYPDENVVAALIAGLRDEDFAVAHQCEEALVQLTGRTHNADALAWEKWVSENREELFVHAGEVPESRRPPYRNRVEKLGYDSRELLRYLWPGTKEE